MSRDLPLKVLFGVCGIGLGHVYRQLPLIEFFLRNGSQILIFAYDKSLEFFSQRYLNHPRVAVAEVAVPFFVGNKNGLDFTATRHMPCNQSVDYFGCNSKALERAALFLGKPDLVISDYEPISAQYAYAYNAPFITIDQQSKYFEAETWEELNGLSCRDEAMRLRMFFPRADLRIATSFFRLPHDWSPSHVQLHGPILRESIIAHGKCKREMNKSIICYLSAHQPLTQGTQEILEILSVHKDWNFHVFLSADTLLPSPASHISVHAHGSSNFDRELAHAAGIISTAGHSLLSEAMFLGIPVFALPLNVYEQHMNARIIQEHEFGMSEDFLSKAVLSDFLKNLPRFRSSIEEDRSVLIRKDGLESILSSIRKTVPKWWETEPARGKPSN